MKDCEWVAGDFDLNEGFDVMKDFDWAAGGFDLNEGSML